MIDRQMDNKASNLLKADHSYLIDGDTASAT